MKHEAKREILSMAQEFSKKFLPHPYFGAAYDAVINAIEFHGTSVEVPCLAITGPPGVGKTTLRKKLAAEYKPVPDGVNIPVPGSPDLVTDRVPLLQFDMPSNPTVISICQQGLKALGDPLWAHGLRTQLIYRFETALRQHKVKGILFDEAQRLVDRSGTLVKGDVFDWLNTLHAATGCIFILIGLGRLVRLFDSEGQIDRRWDGEIRMEPYRWLKPDGGPDEEGQDNFMATLAGLQQAFPIPFKPDCLIDDMSERSIAAALRFYHVSKGRLGLLVKLFAAILRRAHAVGGADVVDLPLLAEAWQLAFKRGTRVQENPFLPGWTPHLENGQPNMPIPDQDDYAPLNPPPRQRRRRDKAREVKEALNTA